MLWRFSVKIWLTGNKYVHWPSGWLYCFSYTQYLSATWDQETNIYDASNDANNEGNVYRIYPKHSDVLIPYHSCPKFELIHFAV